MGIHRLGRAAPGLPIKAWSAWTQSHFPSARRPHNLQLLREAVFLLQDERFFPSVCPHLWVRQCPVPSAVVKETDTKRSTPVRLFLHTQLPYHLPFSKSGQRPVYQRSEVLKKQLLYEQMNKRQCTYSISSWLFAVRRQSQGYPGMEWEMRVIPREIAVKDAQDLHSREKPGRS